MRESLGHDCSLHSLLSAAELSEWHADLQTGLLCWSVPDGWDWTEPSDTHCGQLSKFVEAVHPDDRAIVKAAIATAVGRGGRWAFECRLRLGRSQVRWLEIKGHVTDEGGKVRYLHGVAADITSKKQAEATASGQHRALELAVSGQPLKSVLDALTSSLEHQSNGSLFASVLLVDAQGATLCHGSTGSLPAQFCDVVSGMQIGPRQGSCGTAACFGIPVFATDIATDDLWVNYRQAALTHGLKACWSLPIRSVTTEILGTLACYAQEARQPTESERSAMQLLANTAALVIERDRQQALHLAARRDLDVSEEMFRSLVRATSSVVWTANESLEIDTPQPSWGAFTGQSYEAMQGFGWTDAVHPDDLPGALKIGEIMRRTLQPMYAEYRLLRADGLYRAMSGYAVPILNPDGTLRHWAGSYMDVTERKEAEQRLHRLANHDPLTGLPNRSYLTRHLQELFNFTPTQTNVAVMLIDLDHFKQVNDCMGHGAGDRMLCEVAKRLREILPDSDLIARLGGDEFVVVAHVMDRTAAVSLADKLIETLSVPITVGSNHFDSSASIGISLYPEQGRTSEDLIQHADIAMYRAKTAGGGRAQIFSPDMVESAKSRVAMKTALREALTNGEMHVYYQPRLSLPDLEVQGVEALIRWERPGHGFVSPMEFIPIAEETGIIDELGLWVLETACADIAAINRECGKSLCLSVNLSPRQLKSPLLLGRVATAVSKAGFDPTLLELEVTEGALIEDLEASSQIMRELKTLGLKIAVDDFGTGYSGLTYLRRFPIDVVKLDRSFVSDIAGNIDNYQFTKAIVDMARTLRLHVVAEGVEDAETLELLKQAGCNEAQGYFFAKPFALERLKAYLLSP